jgi:hypothetical protein
MAEEARASHLSRLENLKVAVYALQTAVFNHGIHHIDAKLRYEEMINALNKVNDRMG